MSKQTILSYTDNTALFEGNFGSFSDCLEQAIAEKINLKNADFRKRNLSNACLDDGRMPGADFSGCNLTRTNISECELQNSIFRNTDLFNVCFAYSNLKNCRFEEAAFGATDITGADISRCVFSTLSAFSLDFSSAGQMKECRFVNEDGHSLHMSRPPLVLKGFGRRPFVFTETAWLHGTTINPYEETFRHVTNQITNAESMG